MNRFSYSVRLRSSITRKRGEKVLHSRRYQRVASLVRPPETQCGVCSIVLALTPLYPPFLNV